MTEAIRPREIQPQIQDPDLANVMGYAEYPLVEVARTAEQQGMAQIAEDMYSRANQAAIRAGRDWVSEKQQRLFEQIDSVADQRLVMGHAAIKDYQRPATQESRTLPLPAEQEGIQDLQPPEGMVGHQSMARIAAFIATRSPDDIIYRDSIAQSLNLSAGTLSKAVTALVKEGFVTEETYRRRNVGAPKQRLTGTEKLDQYIAGVPAWRRASDLFAIAERLGLTEEEATAYLLDLGKMSLSALQTGV